MKARVNTMKGRQWWRPFGPSILAGHEAEWFEPAFDSRFMLFTVPVREDKQGDIPAVLHVDGTTRPQSVHKALSPRYHADQPFPSAHRRVHGDQHQLQHGLRAHRLHTI